MPLLETRTHVDYAEMTYLMYHATIQVERAFITIGVGRTAGWPMNLPKSVAVRVNSRINQNRSVIEFFQGGHSISWQPVFDFLHKHLNWPDAAAGKETQRGTTTGGTSFVARSRQALG